MVRGEGDAFVRRKAEEAARKALRPFNRNMAGQGRSPIVCGVLNADGTKLTAYDGRIYNVKMEGYTLTGIQCGIKIDSSTVLIRNSRRMIHSSDAPLLGVTRVLVGGWQDEFLPSGGNNPSDASAQQFPLFGIVDTQDPDNFYALLPDGETSIWDSVPTQHVENTGLDGFWWGQMSPDGNHLAIVRIVAINNREQVSDPIVPDPNPLVGWPVSGLDFAAVSPDLRIMWAHYKNISFNTEDQTIEFEEVEHDSYSVLYFGRMVDDTDVPTSELPPWTPLETYVWNTTEHIMAYPAMNWDEDIFGFDLIGHCVAGATVSFRNTATGPGSTLGFYARSANAGRVWTIVDAQNNTGTSNVLDNYVLCAQASAVSNRRNLIGSHSTGRNMLGRRVNSSGSANDANYSMAFKPTSGVGSNFIYGIGNDHQAAGGWYCPSYNSPSVAFTHTLIAPSSSSFIYTMDRERKYDSSPPEWADIKNNTNAVDGYNNRVKIDTTSESFTYLQSEIDGSNISIDLTNQNYVLGNIVNDGDTKVGVFIPFPFGGFAGTGAAQGVKHIMDWIKT